MRRVILLTVLASAFAAAPAHAMVSMCNVPIQMSDGLVLRANLFLPGDGKGSYPTVLTATGYNKDATNPTGRQCGTSGALATVNQKVIDQGMAAMLLDDRGTGASQGRWDSWGQRTQDDYGEVLDWIQAQKWSDGKVGMTGGSYMGITSLLVAEKDAERVAAGKPRAVKAIWAEVPMADAYRDVTFHGGSTDTGFIPLWLGLTSGLSDVPPSNFSEDPSGAAQNYAGHLQNNFDFAAARMVEATRGEDGAYDGPFYRLRSPVERIKSIRVPVAWTGGWWDIFQRGEPLLYEQMANAPVKKFWMIPQYHGGPDATIWGEQKIGAEQDVMVRWFQHYLQGADNGVEKLPPVNLYAMGANRWQHQSQWPVPGVKRTPYYLDVGGKLGVAKPSSPSSDTTPLLPASSPCSRMTAQWTAGSGAVGPCPTDNRTWEAPSLTYTTPPLAKDTEVTGPISANVWAELTSAKDATLVAVLSDVDPSSGASNQVSAGFLLASQRAIDPAKSTPWRPYHPFTRASQEAVVPNEAYQYRIEIYPTSQVFLKGHQIRLTIGTADTPATGTPVPDLINELGSITLLHGPAYPSNVLLPVVGPVQRSASSATTRVAKARHRRAKARHRHARKHRRHAR